jgi:hypothetical protein
MSSDTILHLNRGPIVSLSNSATKSVNVRIAISLVADEMIVTWQEAGQNGGEYDIMAKRRTGGVWQGTQMLPTVKSSKNSFILRTPGGSNVFWQAQPSGSWDCMFSWQ